MKDMKAWLRSGYLKDTNWVVHVDDHSQEWMLKDVMSAQRSYPEAWLNDPGRPLAMHTLTQHILHPSVTLIFHGAACLPVSLIAHNDDVYVFKGTEAR